MAVDYGRARLGIAVSDPSRTVAFPHSALEASPKPTEPPAALLALVASVAPAEIVVGIPLRLDGTPGEMANEAREFGRALGEATGVSIIEWDERLSTVRAERTIRETGRSGGRRGQRRRPQGGQPSARGGARGGGARGGRADAEKGRADMVAAAHFLQSFLESEGA